MKFRLHKSPTDERYPFKIKRKEWILNWANKQGGLGIELGCGHSRVSNDILSTDIIGKGKICNEIEGFVSEADMMVDATALPFANESFDFIISSNMIEHIEKVKDMIENWIRNLRKNGILIIVTPDARYWEHSLGHVKEYTSDELKELFSEFDIEILELDTAEWHKTELNIVVRKNEI